jgi:hypothetical protein
MVTIVVSRVIINWESAMAASPHHRRACSRTGSTAAAPPAALSVLVIAERHLLGIGGRELHIHYLSAGKVEDIDNVAHYLPIGK